MENLLKEVKEKDAILQQQIDQNFMFKELLERLRAEAFEKQNYGSEVEVQILEQKQGYELQLVQSQQSVEKLQTQLVELSRKLQVNEGKNLLLNKQLAEYENSLQLYQRQVEDQQAQLQKVEGVKQELQRRLAQFKPVEELLVQKDIQIELMKREHENYKKQIESQIVHIQQENQKNIDEMASTQEQMKIEFYQKVTQYQKSLSEQKARPIDPKILEQKDEIIRQQLE